MPGRAGAAAGGGVHGGGIGNGESGIGNRESGMGIRRGAGRSRGDGRGWAFLQAAAWPCKLCRSQRGQWLQGEAAIARSACIRPIHEACS
ncbi:hypothetical protein EIP99_21800 [Xanthomonas campestris pv. raphani]